MRDRTALPETTHLTNTAGHPPCPPSSWPPLPPYVPVPCPSWCSDRTHEDDYDRVAGTRSPHHHAEPAVMRTADPDQPRAESLRRTVTVHLERLDHSDRDGLPAIAVDGIDRDDYMRLSDAETLARLLLEVVARARAAAADVVPMVVCVDCGHEFNPDSSPDLERCWQCAERADAEAGEPA